MQLRKKTQLLTDVIPLLTLVAIKVYKSDHIKTRTYIKYLYFKFKVETIFIRLQLNRDYIEWMVNFKKDVSKNTNFNLCYTLS